MKNISTYISEKLRISSSLESYSYSPSSRTELVNIVDEIISKDGYNADLNCIDVSNITNMMSVFNHSHYCNVIGNIDISEWDVSNVSVMTFMFERCANFNSDLSKWNVSNVKDMSYMFAYCRKFNSDLSGWDVSNVEDMYSMFCDCNSFNSDISEWNVKKVKDLRYAFCMCNSLECDFTKWKIRHMKTNKSLTGCKSLKSQPNWYKDDDIWR